MILAGGCWALSSAGCRVEFWCLGEKAEPTVISPAQCLKDQGSRLLAARSSSSTTTETRPLSWPSAVIQHFATVATKPARAFMSQLTERIKGLINPSNRCWMCPCCVGGVVLEAIRRPFRGAKIPTIVQFGERSQQVASFTVMLRINQTWLARLWP